MNVPDDIYHVKIRDMFDTHRILLDVHLAICRNARENGLVCLIYDNKLLEKYSIINI